ncbi:MAG: hypothetical protein ABI779_07145 [Acidobacteriota bacterium]
MRQVLVLVLMALEATVAFAEHDPKTAPIVATVTLPHAQVLPGVPFDIEVTFTNVSARPATVGLIANLVVTTSDGQTILLEQADANDHWNLDRNSNSDSSLQLAPGESVRMVAGWDRGSIPNWFHYSSSFSGSGNYQIGLKLERGFGDDQYNDHVNYVGVLRTSSAHLERMMPVGEDEILWKRMQHLAGQRWTDSSFSTTKGGVALADEIVLLHPTSQYYPYALLLRSEFKQKDDIAPLLEAAERFTNSPAYPYLLKAAGDAALYEATAAERRDDVASAARYYELVQTYYDRALKTDNQAIRGGAGGAEFGLRSAARFRAKHKAP